MRKPAAKMIETLDGRMTLADAQRVADGLRAMSNAAERAGDMKSAMELADRADAMVPYEVVR